MAKVKLAPILSDLSGKLANAVFTKGRSILAVRTRVHPSNPKSSAQVAIRNFFKNWSAAWKAQSVADIVTWNHTAAKQSKSNHYGDVYHTTGHKLFVAQNMINSEFGNGVVITVPQIPVAPTAVAISTFEAIETGQLVHFTSGDAVGANTVLIVYASAPMSAGRSNFKGTYRKIKTFPGATAAGVLEFGTEYVAKYGAIVTGQKIAVITKQTNVHATVKSTLYGNNGELAGKVKLS